MRSRFPATDCFVCNPIASAVDTLDKKWQSRDQKRWFTIHRSQHKVYERNSTEPNCEQKNRARPGRRVNARSNKKWEAIPCTAFVNKCHRKSTLLFRCMRVLLGAAATVIAVWVSLFLLLLLLLLCSLARLPPFGPSISVSPGWLGLSSLIGSSYYAPSNRYYRYDYCNWLLLFCHFIWSLSYQLSFEFVCVRHALACTLARSRAFHFCCALESLFDFLSFAFCCCFFLGIVIGSYCAQCCPLLRHLCRAFVAVARSFRECATVAEFWLRCGALLISFEFHWFQQHITVAS